MKHEWWRSCRNLLIVLLVIVLFIAASCVKIVPQASAYVVESLGKYKGTWATGLHLKFRLSSAWPSA